VGGHRRWRAEPARVHPRAHGTGGESGVVRSAGARDRHPDRRDPRRPRARRGARHAPRYRSGGDGRRDPRACAWLIGDRLPVSTTIRAMRPLRLLALVALFLALSPSPAAAADIRSGDVTIGTTETIDDDLYVFGSNVAINGTIHGDLIATGNNISVDGNVTGDVFAVGQGVMLGGTAG